MTCKTTNLIKIVVNLKVGPFAFIQNWVANLSFMCSKLCPLNGRQTSQVNQHCELPEHTSFSVYYSPAQFWLTNAGCGDSTETCNRAARAHIVPGRGSGQVRDKTFCVGN